MRIAQITDLHIAKPTEKPFDVDVRGNFLQVLQSVEFYDPDIIVLTGDLSFHDGDRDACEWIYEQISRLNKPIFAIAGNHDKTDTLADVFSLGDEVKEGELFYERSIDDRQLLFLDSAVGKLSAKQKTWLKEKLSGRNDMALIFIHHPPAFANLPHMDNNYPLQDKEEVCEIMHDSGRECQVFCGHYHIERSISFPRINIFISPSCYIQISDRSEDFSVDHTIPAWRKIEIDERGFRSSVQYCF